MDKELILKLQNTQTPADFISILNQMKSELFGNGNNNFSKDCISYYTIINLPLQKKYHKFLIPKKNGAFRNIWSPTPMLKTIQYVILEVLQTIYTPNYCVTGFVPGKSIVDNAKQHLGKKYVYNIDLANFFENISGGMVLYRLQKPPFNFNNKIALLIMRICCEDTSNILYSKQYLYGISKSWEICRKNLPQGAPTSPILSNAVCDSMDSKIIKLCKAFNITYTRYADDLTFSCMNNVFVKDKKKIKKYYNTNFPFEIPSSDIFNNNSNQIGSDKKYYEYDKDKCDFITELENIISAKNFIINKGKTRLRKIGEHQEVTGLVISNKVNVKRKFIKDIRNILYIWRKYGYKEAEISYLKFISKQNKFITKTKINASLKNVLSGKLDFLKMVRGEEDLLYLKFKKEYDILCGDMTPKPDPAKTKSSSSVVVKLKNGSSIICEITNLDIPNSIKVNISGLTTTINFADIDQIKELE